MSFQYFGEFIAFCTVLSWSIGIFPFTEAARRIGPNPVNHFRLVLAVILLTIILLLFFPLSPKELFSAPLPEHWLWFGLSGIVGLSLGDYFGFTSFAILGTRLGSIFSTLSPGAALIFGFILLGESINMVGVFGMTVTILGVVWISLSKKEKAKIQDLGHGKVEKGFLFGILAALCQGIGLVMAKKGMSYSIESNEISSIHIAWMRMIVATLVIYLITTLRGKLKEMTIPVLQNKNNGFPFICVGTIFGPTMGVSLSMLTVSLINVSVAQTIFSLVPVVVLPLGYIFYKEKITLKSLAGAFIAIAGVLILIWRDFLQSRL